MSIPSISRSDVFSPANFVSIIGLCFTLYGAFYIETLAGVLILGAGRFIDVFDGKIARATHVSPLGALVDATCDKIGMAALLPAAWFAGIAPYWLLIYIAAQNVLNIALSAMVAARGGNPAASKSGKYAMFIQNISVGFYALGNTLDIKAFTVIGLVVGIASFYFAYQATYGYAKLLPKRAHK